MKQWNLARLLVTLLTSLLVWLVPAWFCMCVGSNGRYGWPSGEMLRTMRLQTVGVASLVGASLAAAGVVYQAILRNPLADPYLLGVSSGASLMAYVWGFPFANNLFGPALVALGQQAFAFAGALIAVSVVLTLASRRGRMQPVTLLLVGVIVNAIAGSLFLLLNAMRRSGWLELVRLWRFWLVGFRRTSAVRSGGLPRYVPGRVGSFSSTSPDC